MRGWFRSAYLPAILPTLEELTGRQLSASLFRVEPQWKISTYRPRVLQQSPCQFAPMTSSLGSGRREHGGGTVRHEEGRRCGDLGLGLVQQFDAPLATDSRAPVPRFRGASGCRSLLRACIPRPAGTVGQRRYIPIRHRPLRRVLLHGFLLWRRRKVSTFDAGASQRSLGPATIL